MGASGLALTAGGDGGRPSDPATNRLLAKIQGWANGRQFLRPNQVRKPPAGRCSVPEPADASNVAVAGLDRQISDPRIPTLGGEVAVDVAEEVDGPGGVVQVDAAGWADGMTARLAVAVAVHQAATCAVAGPRSGFEVSGRVWLSGQAVTKTVVFDTSSSSTTSRGILQWPPVVYPGTDLSPPRWTGR